LAAKVDYIEHLGALDHVYARYDNHDVRVHAAPALGIRAGDTLKLAVIPHDILLFEENGKCLTGATAIQDDVCPVASQSI
jgi:hypothetical protein